MSDAAGSITFHMWDQTSWTDGWFPNNQRRIGYNDPGHGWDLMGTFVDNFITPTPMTHQGNGLYTAQLTPNAGIYDFKFRKAGDWEVNYGADFSHGSNNNQVAVLETGDVWNFELDLPNGRWRAWSPTQHGDFNADGDTNAADYVTWRQTMAGNTAKFNEWREDFGRTANWLARGSFGTDVVLTDQGGGHYTANLTGLTAGTEYDVRVLRSDALAAFPGSPVKITANASNEINLHFYKLAPNTTWNDGWFPNTASRVGYADSQQFDWEIVGAFNGWPGTNDPAFALTDQGNGLHTGSFTFNTPGSYDFKFRRLAATNPWSTSIGPDFGNSAGNNNFTVANAGQIWNFELDLLNGKWRAYVPAGSGLGAVPEPASVALVIFGLAMMSLKRRREIA
jgi:hypothetical protein